MKRARVIIKEIRITRQGEIKNFQIKVPKNATRIIAIDTDVRINPKRFSAERGKPEQSPVEASAGVSIEGNSKQPYLFWNPGVNPPLGKLKLRSRERTNIFYEHWLHFIQFNGGIPNMSMELFNLNPASLNKNTLPKTVDVPKETTLINGLFEEYFGKLIKQDIDYTIKVFVWIETEEDADGVVFEFQKEETEAPRISEGKNAVCCKCCVIKCETINVK